MKIVFGCLVFVMALGSSAPADIYQEQNTLIGLGNDILLLQGDQAADAVQNLAVYNQQGATSGAGQSFTGNLTEIGHASSGGADIGLQQNLAAAGLQTQDISGFWGLQMQMPSVGDALYQMFPSENSTASDALPGLDAGTAILGLQSSSTDGVPLLSLTAQGAILTMSSPLLALP
jgi:hypothetical protein